MKNSSLKVTGLILLIALFSVFAVISFIGTMNPQLAQYNEKQISYSKDLGISNEEEEWYSPYISIDTCSYYGYAEPPHITVEIWDSGSLEGAYYQVDSYMPLGTETENWTSIAVSGNHTAVTFTMDIHIFNALTEGLHKVYFKAWDEDENVTDGNETDFWAFYKDLTPPQFVKILSPVEGETVSGKFTITVKANDTEGGSGIAVVKFWAGPPEEGEYIGEVWEPVPGENGIYELKLNTNEGKEGSYQLYVRAYDCAENSLDDGPINIIVKHENNNILIIALVSVGAVALAVTTTYVVKYRHRPGAYEKTVSKLGQVKQPKQPMPSKMKSPILSDSAESTYLIPETSESTLELSDKINQLSLSEAQKQELSIELQGLPSEERILVSDAIIGSITPTEAKSQLDSLMKELEHLEQEENWTEALNKLEQGIGLAEFLGDQTLFNNLLNKIDELRAIKGL